MKYEMNVLKKKSKMSFIIIIMIFINKKNNKKKYNYKKMISKDYTTCEQCTLTKGG